MMARGIRRSLNFKINSEAESLKNAVKNENGNNKIKIVRYSLSITPFSNLVFIKYTNNSSSDIEK
jgi:hypothetical protein